MEQAVIRFSEYHDPRDTAMPGRKADWHIPSTVRLRRARVELAGRADRDRDAFDPYRFSRAEAAMQVGA